MDRNLGIFGLVSLAAAFAGPLAVAQVRSGAPSSSSPAASSGLGGMSTTAPSQGGSIVGGPPGPSVGRIQPGLLRPPSVNVGPAEALALPAPLPAHEIPVDRPLAPGGENRPSKEDSGPEGGITLDEAVGHVIHENLELRARFSDISQADSDVLTASLRTNPILYADAQQVPYGPYSMGFTGGPTQYDINIVYPLDLSHKRQARTRAAIVARQLIEASYKDAVRLTVDNLYTAYVDALMAQESYDRATGKNPDTMSKIPIEEPSQALWDTQRKLAVLMNLPSANVARRQLHGRLGYRIDDEKLPPPSQLVRIALENRPDLAAQRLAVCLAEANLKAVMANRFDDVLVLYQPYTFKSGAPFDQKNGLAWALGVTVPLPIYNRQQGNLRKARQIADQSRIRLASLEQAVASDVQGALLEHEAAHEAYKRTKTEFEDYDTWPIQLLRKLNLPAEDPLGKEYKRLQDQLNELRLDAVTDKLKKHYEATVRHRKSRLAFNTVTGSRIED